MSNNLPPGLTGLEPEIVGYDEAEYPFHVWAMEHREDGWEDEVVCRTREEAVNVYGGMVDTLVYANGPVVEWRPGRTKGTRYTVGITDLTGDEGR
jgi:hypothetical protein